MIRTEHTRRKSVKSENKKPEKIRPEKIRQGMPGSRGKERIYEEADSDRKPAA